MNHLVRDDIIADIEIDCVIGDVHIIINTCIRIVECILINPTVAVVEIRTCREIILAHNISHVVVDILVNIALNIHVINWNVHSIHVIVVAIVEIHLVLIEVIHVILVVILIILVPLILVIALLLIRVAIIASCWLIVVIPCLARDHLQILSLQCQQLSFVTLTLLNLLHDVHCSLCYFRLD